MPTIADPNPPFGEVPEPGETSTLFDAYSQVDVARSEYFGACTQYAATPATYKTDEINRTINEYADRVDTLMHLIGEEENCDPVRFIKIASGVLVTEDSERTNLFESLVGEGKFQKLVDVRDAIEQQVVEEVSEAASNEEATHAALHEFMDMLRGGLTVDTQKLVKEIDNSDQAKRILRRKELGKHALDVGKTAIGTLAGAAILQAFNTLRRR
jgi:hypothetical protein